MNVKARPQTTAAVLGFPRCDQQSDDGYCMQLRDSIPQKRWLKPPSPSGQYCTGPDNGRMQSRAGGFLSSKLTLQRTYHSRSDGPRKSPISILAQWIGQIEQDDDRLYDLHVARGSWVTIRLVLLLTPAWRETRRLSSLQIDKLLAKPPLLSEKVYQPHSRCGSQGQDSRNRRNITNPGFRRFLSIQAI